MTTGTVTSAGRRATLWGVLGVLLCLVTGAAWVGAVQSAPGRTHEAPSRFGLTVANCYMATRFAGYSTVRPVRQLSAQWVIPSVVDPSAADAATSIWVAVQNTASAFFQVGVRESVRGSVPGAPVPGGEVSYRAFWSSTTKEDKAQPLFAVTPGNLVLAGISRTHAGWRMAVRDVTTGRAAVVDVGRGRFTRADWMEEDSSPACGIAPVTRTTTVAMRHLLLNHKAPKLRYSDATIMESPNGVVLVPSRVHGDGFALAPPAGLPGRYLSDTATFNIAFETLMGAAGEARVDAVATRDTALVQKGVRLQLTTTLDRAVASARQALHKLASLRLPGVPRRTLQDVESRLSALTASLKAAAAHFERSTVWTWRSVALGSVRLAGAAARLRRNLGLPPAQAIASTSLSDAPL